MSTFSTAISSVIVYYVCINLTLWISTLVLMASFSPYYANLSLSVFWLKIVQSKQIKPQRRLHNGRFQTLGMKFVKDQFNLIFSLQSPYLCISWNIPKYFGRFGRSIKSGLSWKSVRKRLFWGLLETSNIRAVVTR